MGLRVSRESVAEEHFLSGRCWIVKNDFGYDFEFVFVFKGHNEVENSLKLGFEFSEFCKERVIYVLDFGFKKGNNFSNNLFFIKKPGVLSAMGQ
jgi:hypothetical protein